jgi:hypothetical protein
LLQKQGNLAAALKSYQDSLAIADRLIKADPSNAEWQSDLSSFHENIGNVLVAQNNQLLRCKAIRLRLPSGKVSRSWARQIWYGGKT